MLSVGNPSSPTFLTDSCRVLINVTTVGEKALMLGSRLRENSGFSRVHGWIRLPRRAAGQAVQWWSLGVAGLIVCTFIFSLVLLLVGPYLAILLWLVNYTPHSASPENRETGTLILIASAVIFATGHQIVKSYPQLKDMDNLTGLEKLPAILQVAIYFAFLGFCSLILAVMTFDLVVAVNWIFFGAFFAITVVSRALSRTPWYVLVPLAISVPLILISWIIRVHNRGEELTTADQDVHKINCKLRRNLQV